MSRFYAATMLAAVLLLSTGSVHAKDFCFNSTSASPAVLVVAPKFSMPKRGKCSAIVGWDAGYFGSAAARPASGTACLNTAGTNLHVGITIHATRVYPLGADEQPPVHMIPPYPAPVGGAVYLRQDLPAMGQERTDGMAGPCGYTVTIP